MPIDTECPSCGGTGLALTAEERLSGRIDPGCYRRNPCFTCKGTGKRKPNAN